jgi:lipopolysaccharide heptosyltransferase II
MPGIEKILIIRFSSLGDIILASPLIRIIRAAHPSAKIDFLVKMEFADAVRFNPHISSVISLKTSDWQELRLLKKNIRQTGYDLIIDLHNSLRSRYIRWGTGAVHTAVVRKNVIKRFFLVTLGWNFYRKNISVAERYCKTVRKYGPSDDGEGLEIFFPEETASAVSSVIERFKPEKYEVVVGLAPTAKHGTKRWLPERFVELGVDLAKRYHCRIFLFGSKEENDFCGDMVQMINAHAGHAIAENFAGKLTLLETAAALDYCHVVVSNDSALMHMAAARKRNIVALFGSTVKELGFFPYRTRNIVVEKTDVHCRPCSHIGLKECPKKHFRCMKDIPAGDVMKAIEEILVR